MSVGDAKSDNIFRFLVEQSPDGHFVLFGDTFAYMNEAAAEMFGLERPLDPKLRVYDVLASGEAERVRRNMSLRRTGVLRGAAIYVAQRADGATFPIEVHAAPVESEGRTGLHGVIRDITARRKMESRLDQLARTHLVSRLTSGIAHDLNNLWAIIGTNLDLIERDPSNQAALDGVKRARAAVGRGARKAGHIGLLAEVALGEEDLTPTHLNPLVEEVIELCRAWWRDEAELRGVVYEPSWRPGQPGPIEAAPAEVRVALIALFANALEAMPGGGQISLSTGKSEDGRSWVELKDEGEGMADTRLSRLSDAFYSTRAGRQMGLGLALVRGVAERHRATVELESTPDEGTAVTLIFPRCDRAPKAPPAPPRVDLLVRRASATVAGGDRPKTRGGRSVLLIDDQPDLVQVVEELLGGRGFVVGSATTGREALALARSNRYSVVVTDLSMPDMSGWDLAAQVRELQAKTPILLTTGWAAEIDRSKLKMAGIDAMLPKPFRSAALVETILQLVERRS